MKKPIVKNPNVDTIHLCISDPHTCSNYALFLNRQWKGMNGRIWEANSYQRKIRKHFDAMTDRFAKICDGKKIRFIMNGDSTEGFHHGSVDITTFNEMEMADIHIEIFSQFQKRIGWKRGDEVYYVKGTHVHVGDWEDYIGREMNAVMTPDGYYSWDFLPLETNGVLSWFVHHGASAGEGDNEGNALRNTLKNVNSSAKKDGVRTPDIVYFGHVHKPAYNVFAYREEMQYKLLHGIILPSLQMKTRYVWGKSPLSRNKIGGVTHEIRADGQITVPIFDTMSTDLFER